MAPSASRCPSCYSRPRACSHAAAATRLMAVAAAVAVASVWPAYPPGGGLGRAGHQAEHAGPVHVCGPLPLGSFSRGPGGAQRGGIEGVEGEEVLEGLEGPRRDFPCCCRSICNCYWAVLCVMHGHCTACHYAVTIPSLYCVPLYCHHTVTVLHGTVLPPYCHCTVNILSLYSVLSCHFTACRPLLCCHTGGRELFL